MLKMFMNSTICKYKTKNFYSHLLKSIAMLFCINGQQINSANAYANQNNQEHLKASENAKAIYAKSESQQKKYIYIKNQYHVTSEAGE